MGVVRGKLRHALNKRLVLRYPSSKTHQKPPFASGACRPLIFASPTCEPCPNYFFLMHAQMAYLFTTPVPGWAMPPPPPPRHLAVNANQWQWQIPFASSLAPSGLL
jgi:hypothetical protein